MPLLGAHMSIAGGYYNAVEAAAKLKMDCVQIFVSQPRQWPVEKADIPSGQNKNQWRAKPLSDDDVKRFREAMEETGIRKPCAHASYLINLGSPDDALWRKSLDAFVVELQRAEALGLMGLVIHPGSAVGSTAEDSLARVAQALDAARKMTAGFAVEIWLETTAGQGTNLGWRFEQLGWLLNNVTVNDKIGICVDTCHIFAAGYPLRKPSDYAATMQEFDEHVGLNRIRAFHLNDSKRELGSRVDRHEHIGEGMLGREPFRHVLNDPRFTELPMYLETPKGTRERDGKSWDAINMAKLRRMIKQPAKR